MTLEIGQPPTPIAGKSCPITKTYLVGAFDSTTMMTLAATPTTPGQSVISGKNGSNIQCSGTGRGGQFEFSGSISAPSSDASLISISFSNGVVSGENGTADVSVYTPQLLATFGSPVVAPAMPCSFQIVNGQIKGGAMWATFTCPDIESPPTGACGILQGLSAVVLEKCTGS